MDKPHLKVKTSQVAKATGEACAQATKGNELSITYINSEQLLHLNIELMEAILTKSNLTLAYDSVVKNKGCAGIDGMDVYQLRSYLKSHWQTIKAQLQAGTYKPQPVKRVTIPKSGGKFRTLGIPTVLDRFIQQAILQVLQDYIDGSFSEHSYGFRPNRSAHQAIEKSKQYVSQGYGIVVDLDLAEFFDRVNHDKLMSELYKRIKDDKLLTLIRSYLNSGSISFGLFTPTEAGCPQGGPLSPFLSNILLDLLDKELEKRGHKHVRYADDCNIYVKSPKAGKRVKESITNFIINKLKLAVNESKSAVDKVSKRKFLGFKILTIHQKFNRYLVKIGLSAESIRKLKDRVRTITSKSRGISIQKMLNQLSAYLMHWFNYYKKIETPTVLQSLDSWIRRRVRCYQLKQWKTYSGRYQRLIKLGVSPHTAKPIAYSSKGIWRLSLNKIIHRAINNTYLEKVGLKSLSKQLTNRTAVYGPVCTVV